MEVKYFFYSFLVTLIMFFNTGCSENTEPRFTVKNPIIHPEGGSYQVSQNITIASPTPHTTIHFTLDGTQPTSSSKIYYTPLLITASSILKVKVFRQGWNSSETLTELYEISTLIDADDLCWSLIESGEYLSGPQGEILSIDHDYELMVYPVTNSEYISFLTDALRGGIIRIRGFLVEGEHPAHADVVPFYLLGDPLTGYNYGRINFKNDKFFLSTPDNHQCNSFDNHPVVHVTWFGAWAFADFYGLKLPGEDEWEKAARGVDRNRYPWGDHLDSSRVNFLNSGDPWDNGTTPVGFYNGQSHKDFQTSCNSSPYGIYDMIGNVWEWTDSWFGSFRVIKGGSWIDDKSTEMFFLPWYYSSFNPEFQGKFVGFRCMRKVN